MIFLDKRFDAQGVQAALQASEETTQKQKDPETGFGGFPIWRFPVSFRTTMAPIVPGPSGRRARFCRFHKEIRKT